MFRALLCSSSGGLRRNCVYAASGIVTAVTCSVTLYVAAVGTPWTLLGPPSDDIHLSKNIYSDLNTFTVTLVVLQLDAQNSYLFTYNTFIKILYMFRALPCSSSGGPRRDCIYAASGIVTVCR